MGKDRIDTRVDGRLHDGWAYCVDLRDGRTLRLADHQDIDAVWARINQAKDAKESIRFSGARASLEEENDRGQTVQIILDLDGVGIVPASEILVLRLAGTLANQPHDAAYDAARALLECQEAATAEMVEAAQEQQQALGSAHIHAIDEDEDGA